jgi:dTDP-4-dehydrorhamnose 3,5-epimerase
MRGALVSKKVRLVKITPIVIPEVLLITLTRRGDARGRFSETFRARALDGADRTDRTFVQDNHARDAAFIHGEPA